MRNASRFRSGKFAARRFERFRCVVVQQDRAAGTGFCLAGADCDATRDEIDLIPSQQSDLI
jgi:hypothetical protein